MTDEEYEAVVYDLDGTLVRLQVDWEEVEREVGAVLRARGIDTDGVGLWDMIGLADESGYRRPVEETISEHEREGARLSERLPVADELPRDVPVGVCSLNAESACRIALEVHGLDGAVRAIVGRDTVDRMKPDPKPLLTVVEALSADPARTLFVGDSETDAEAARRAGVDFEWASERL